MRGKRSFDTKIGRVASVQYGAFGLSQAVSAGGSKSMVRTRTGSGRWLRLHREVYAVAGSPDTWHRRVVAACLASGPDALAGGRTAATLWGVSGFGPGPVEITVPRGTRVRRRGFVVAESSTLVPADASKRLRIPCVSAPRMLLEIARTTPAEGVESVYHDLRRRRLLQPSNLRWRLDQLAADGHLVPHVLDLLAEGRVVTESELEDRFLRLIRRAGLPDPIAQYRVKRGGRVVARLDFAYLQARVGIELDGYRFHSAPSHLDRDDERQDTLVVMGWRLLRFTWRHVATRPDWTCETVAKAIGATGAR